MAVPGWWEKAALAPLPLPPTLAAGVDDDMSRLRSKIPEGRRIRQVINRIGPDKLQDKTILFQGLLWFQKDLERGQEKGSRKRSQSS